MASQKYNILYGRLSQEDERQGESNSIYNQKLFLEKYAADNGFENTLFLSDDGYSGTNFDRPAWKKIVEMIENGEVETLIVKDLSRLGREYLQVGQLTELYFPEKGVRFIAVNDSVDSLVESSNDFNPIRNWANELHAKDTSKKVRAIKKMQAERGERLGSKPPYGYRKKDAQSKEIIPDEATAPVVCRIFELCAAGKGPNQIARILTREQILNPTNQYYQATGAACNHLDTTRPYSWCGKTVANILENIAYLGHTLSMKHTTLSYKNKKQIRRPESEQILVKNTHAPLVSQELWEIVQEVRQHKRRPPKYMEEPNLFSGLVYCSDCGKYLVLCRTEKMREDQYYFRCSTYGKRGKDVCTPHQIREVDLKQIVLDDLRRVTHFARMKERQFAEYINQKNTLELRREINRVQKELDAMYRRNGELSVLFKRLYEDNVLGRVTNEQFRMLSADYNGEQKELELAIPTKEEQLERLKASVANVDAFIEKAKQYTAIDELTSQLLRLFIQRIEIGERSVRYSRSATQDIRIVYRDIGTMDTPMRSGDQAPKILPPITSKEEIMKMLA
jgi:site-specific DNA recombinase